MRLMFRGRKRSRLWRCKLIWRGKCNPRSLLRVKSDKTCTHICTKLSSRRRKTRIGSFNVWLSSKSWNSRMLSTSRTKYAGLSPCMTMHFYANTTLAAWWTKKKRAWIATCSNKSPANTRPREPNLKNLLNKSKNLPSTLTTTIIERPHCQVFQIRCI